jgi:putative SOS response-associated peptidase YedK
MCYHIRMSAEEKKIAKAMKANWLDPNTFTPKAEFNGFTNPATPIVRFDDPRTIVQYEWGLLGDYLTYKGFDKFSKEALKARNGCLNARIEELETKATYKSKIGNRCIVAMDGMYEWQWASPGATKSDKTKYLVTKPDESVFCCAGLFNEWKDPKTGVITYCYTIVTTEGNDLMKQIHNNGERMLVVLNDDEHEHWLDPKVPHMAFWDRSHIELKAVPTEPKQATLF